MSNPTHLLIELKYLPHADYLKSMGKQISLSNEDIEAKAHDVWKRKYLHTTNNNNGSFSEGYKQALNDLLK